ncbi:MAG: hypothetical protein WCI74_15165, partial [Actinomycetes bacterium]
MSVRPNRADDRQPWDYDQLIANAATQAGVLSREQILLAGWTDSMIRSCLVGHRWTTMLRGVYSTVTGTPSIVARWWAAYLYGGLTSRIAGESALQAWGARRRELPVVLAIPASRSLAGVPGELIVVRQSRMRPARTPAECPPTVVLAHAVLDVLATETDQHRVIDLVTRVCQSWPWTVAELERSLGFYRYLPHRSLIVSLLAEARDGATTALEIPGVQNILRSHGLPTGRGQVREYQRGAVVVRDRVIDDFGVVIEFDGRMGHDDPAGRFRDHRRDNAVAASGRVALRFGRVDVHREPCEAAAQVATVLAGRGWTGFLE